MLPDTNPGRTVLGSLSFCPIYRNWGSAGCITDPRQLYELYGCQDLFCNHLHKQHSSFFFSPTLFFFLSLLCSFFPLSLLYPVSLHLNLEFSSHEVSLLVQKYFEVLERCWFYLYTFHYPDSYQMQSHYTSEGYTQFGFHNLKKW